jgi:hypothetical protein
MALLSDWALANGYVLFPELSETTIFSVRHALGGFCNLHF